MAGAASNTAGSGVDSNDEQTSAATVRIQGSIKMVLAKRDVAAKKKEKKAEKKAAKKKKKEEKKKQASAAAMLNAEEKVYLHSDGLELGTLTGSGSLGATSSASPQEPAAGEGKLIEVVRHS